MSIAAVNPLAVAILGFVTLQRLAELVIARRNTRRLLERGGREVAPGHYPLIVGVHAAWLTGLWQLAMDGTPNLAWLAVYGGLELARVWVLITLGDRWTTRIIVLPGAPLIETGPYRFVSHPNYWVVAGEILVLPLVFGLYWYAAAFSLANAAVLAVRTRAENAALKALNEGGFPSD